MLKYSLDPHDRLHYNTVEPACRHLDALRLVHEDLQRINLIIPVIIDIERFAHLKISRSYKVKRRQHILDVGRNIQGIFFIFNGTVIDLIKLDNLVRPVPPFTYVFFEIPWKDALNIHKTLDCIPDFVESREKAIGFRCGPDSVTGPAVYRFD